jgi:hypothetical protein
LNPSGNGIKAVVHYTNDSTFTFRTSVTINCRAYGPGGKVIGADNVYVLAKDSGPIVPGLQAEMALSFPLEGKDYAGLRCTAFEAE